jgi:ferredoxin
MSLLEKPPALPDSFLRVEPAGYLLPVLPGQSLLEAALAAGVLLPSSCRVGTCRTCRCRLSDGQVSYRVDWPGLSAEERAEGEVLPCVALPQSELRRRAGLPRPRARCRRCARR